MRRPSLLFPAPAIGLAAAAGFLGCGTSDGRSNFNEPPPETKTPGPYDDLVAVDIVPAEATLTGGDQTTTQAARSATRGARAPTS